MDRYARFVVNYRKPIVVIFLIATIVCAVMFFGVRVNYNMVDYLPESAQSTQAVHIMDEEFTEAVPNASVMVSDVSVGEALAYKAQLAELPGVIGVMWLDDAVDVKQPLDTYDAETVEGFYKNGNALYSVTIEEGNEGAAIEAINSLEGKDVAITGEAVDNEAMRQSTVREVINAVLILVPIIVLILILATGAWIEPLLLLFAIAVSIIINMGTNLAFGSVSFITNAVTPILQLAVSLDYAVFLLHSYADFRKLGEEPETAIRFAIKKTVVSVSASAATTLFGFGALMFMEFGIGADLGMSLAKGIIFSFISCMLFLPACTLIFANVIEKTKHRPFLPNTSNIYRVVRRVAVPVFLVVVVIVVPSFLGQSRTAFTYGNADDDPTSEVNLAKTAIEENFGQSLPVAILVPRGDVVSEYELGESLKELDHVTGVVSYAASVGTTIPTEIAGETATSQFYSDDYARIIAYVDTPTEGKVAFATVENIEETIARYYDTYYAAGQSVNMYDMEQVVYTDNTMVNIAAVISIFLVLLVAFRAAILPFILLFTIEAGIWINLAIPYFTGDSLNFIGFLVISTVQLGATVDYAILLTSYYLDNRMVMDKKKAMHEAMGQTFKSIIVSAMVLAAAGFTLWLTSSNPPVADLGLLIGRGAIISFVMVLCVLPILLRVFDVPIGITTYKARFLKATAAPTSRTSETKALDTSPDPVLSDSPLNAQKEPHHE